MRTASVLYFCVNTHVHAFVFACMAASALSNVYTDGTNVLETVSFYMFFSDLEFLFFVERYFSGTEDMFHLSVRAFGRIGASLSFMETP